MQPQAARFSSGTSGRATKQACPATSLVLRCLVLNWDQLAFCVLVFYKLDKANCRKFTTKCKAHIMKSVQNMRQREKRQRREISLLQKCKVHNYGICVKYETKEKETKKGNMFTTKCKVHNYGISAEYETETKKGNKFTTNCKVQNYEISAEYETKEKETRETKSLQNAKCVIIESVQNIRQRKEDKEGKQVYYKMQSPHGIAAEYQAEEKETKKENNNRRIKIYKHFSTT